MRPKEQGGIFFRFLLLLCFLGIVIVLYAARYPLLKLSGEAWVLDEPAVPSDALILLGGDNYAGDRAFHAADLYRGGMASVVVASGRMLRSYVSMAEVEARDLQSFGVPAKAIVKLPSRARNTQEEAAEVAALVKVRRWKSVIVVTSNYHTRRARFIFGRVLPSNVVVHVSSARDSDFDPSHWWETRQGQKLFIVELAGYAAARWELRGNSASQTTESSRMP